MSGFRFPEQNNLSPPALSEPTTPLRPLSNKENHEESPTMFGLQSGQEPITPEVFKRPLNVVKSSTIDGADELPTMEQLLNWTNIPASFCALVTGEATLICGHLMFTRDNVSFLSGCCNLLLISLGLNFARSVFSEQWLIGAKWRESEFEQLLTDRMQDAVKFVMLIRDETVCATSPVTMLKAGSVLLTLSLIGNFVSFWTIAAFLWFLAFVAPTVHYHLGTYLHRIGVLIGELAQMLVQKFKLARSVKLGACAILGSAIMVLSSWGTCMSIGLLFLILVRCTLKKNEVSKFREHKVTQSIMKSPMLNSALLASRKLRSTFTGYADNVLMSAMRSANKTPPSHYRTQ